MILDFNQIPTETPDYKNIKLFFEESQKLGVDPKLPENRQKFNNTFLDKTNKRYLISRYAENRIEMLKGSKIAEEGRTYHLGIDIFSKNLESIYAPCDGEIVAYDKEEGNHSFGNFLVFKPNSTLTENYIFLGHLSSDKSQLGSVRRGDRIAKLGDYMNGENGGWSRHVHVQLLSILPENIFSIPGYSTKEKLNESHIKYPDPSFLIFK